MSSPKRPSARVPAGGVAFIGRHWARHRDDFGRELTLREWAAWYDITPNRMRSALRSAVDTLAREGVALIVPTRGEGYVVAATADEWRHRLSRLGRLAATITEWSAAAAADKVLTGSATSPYDTLVGAASGIEGDVLDALEILEQAAEEAQANA